MRQHPLEHRSHSIIAVYRNRYVALRFIRAMYAAIRRTQSRIFYQVQLETAMKTSQTIRPLTTFTSVLQHFIEYLSVSHFFRSFLTIYIIANDADLVQSFRKTFTIISYGYAHVAAYSIQRPPRAYFAPVRNYFLFQVQKCGYFAPVRTCIPSSTYFLKILLSIAKVTGYALRKSYIVCASLQR